MIVPESLAASCRNHSERVAWPVIADLIHRVWRRPRAHRYATSLLESQSTLTKEP
jgi:hypothetical protein